MPRLLVVEDDEQIGALLQTALRANGYDVTWLRTGRSAISAATSSAYDLALLDLGLPDLDGVEVCRELRAASPGTVIVMLTARRDEMEVVVGLEAGADDYLTKPFGLYELQARVRAHLRRTVVDAVPEQRAVRVGGPHGGPQGAPLPGGRHARCRCGPRSSTCWPGWWPTAGEALSRETLMSDVWDEHWFGSTKTLDVHVAALRRQLVEASAATVPPPGCPRSRPCAASATGSRSWTDGAVAARTGRRPPRP